MKAARKSAEGVHQANAVAAARRGRTASLEHQRQMRSMQTGPDAASRRGLSASGLDNHSSTPDVLDLLPFPPAGHQLGRQRSAYPTVLLSRNLSTSPTWALANSLSPSPCSRQLVRPRPPTRLQAGLPVFESRRRWLLSSPHPTSQRGGYPSSCPVSNAQTATSRSQSMNSENTSALRPFRLQPAALRYRTSSPNASRRWSHLQLVPDLRRHHLRKPHHQLPRWPLVKPRYLRGGRVHCQSPLGNRIRPVPDLFLLRSPR